MLKCWALGGCQEQRLLKVRISTNIITLLLCDISIIGRQGKSTFEIQFKKDKKIFNFSNFNSKKNFFKLRFQILKNQINQYNFFLQF